MVATQPGSIREIQRSPSDFLGLVNIRKLMYAFIRHLNRGRLTRMSYRQIGRNTRQPMKQGGFPGHLITNNSNFHELAVC